MTIRKKDLRDEIKYTRVCLDALSSRVFQDERQISEHARTLKLHGEAHMAQDLLPQFNALCKKVNGHEERLNNSPFSKVVMEDYARRLEELEEWKDAMLSSIPDVEILKVKVKGLEEDRKHLFPHTHTPTDDKIDALDRNLDAGRVQANRQAVAIEKLQKQVAGLENRLSRAQDLIAAMEKEKEDMWKPATRPVDRGCPRCLYGSNGPGEGPCRECFPPEWPNWKPERKPRAPRTRDAGGRFAPKTVTPRKKKVQ